MPVSRSVVLNMLLIIGASVFLAQSIRCRVLGFGLWTCSGHGQFAELCSAWTDECVRPYAILPLALQCPVESLVEGCSGFFVIRGRDLALFSLYLELEQFFFQRFEQH